MPRDTKGAAVKETPIAMCILPELKFKNDTKTLGRKKKLRVMDGHKREIYSYSYSNKNANNQNYLSSKNKSAFNNKQDLISYTNFKKNK